MSDSSESESATIHRAPPASKEPEGLLEGEWIEDRWKTEGECQE